MNMAEATASSVIRMIHENRYVEGDRLPPERELAALLGVSRTTVREALKRLAAWGYIRSVQGGGNYVSRVSGRTQIEFLEVRRAIECETARLAAEHAQPEDLKAIRISLAGMQAEISAGGLGVGGDSDFHAAVAKAAGNNAMCMILEQCCDILNSGRYATLTITGQGEKSLRDHERIADAIEAGDAEGAAREMKEHIEKAIINILKKEGLL